MKTNYLLLPHKYKRLGWIILIPSTILGIILAWNDFNTEWLWANVFSFVDDGKNGNYLYFGFKQTNITNTVIGVSFLIGAILVSFTREKNEDEYIEEIRLSSLMWAVLVNYILLLLAFIFVYGTPFMDVMIYNMFTMLIIFIVRFNYILFKSAKTVSDEKQD